jgi:hypothetical protein
MAKGKSGKSAVSGSLTLPKPLRITVEAEKAAAEAVAAASKQTNARPSATAPVDHTQSLCPTTLVKCKLFRMNTVFHQYKSAIMLES